MALCALKVFDNMLDSTNNILLCFFLCRFFTIFLYILCNHLKMPHHDKLERYNSFDYTMSTRSFIRMLAVVPNFHMHYVFLMYFVLINN
uniref:Putative ovule protein n=1 Tax=Solanum chacoense TaxID=4108 RepID=A0A0V0HWV9_SOLCH